MTTIRESCAFILVLFVILCPVATRPDTTEHSVRIALQPLGPFNGALFKDITAGITEAYPNATVTVLPEKPLPSGAFYEPRQRYRAEKVLDHLDSTAAPGITKTVGLTVKDISTTKGEHEDWGIFGLGTISGPSCVVSTFRLRAGNASDALFRERLVKMVIHELGHTFGLEHCPDTACVMTDACGSIHTVDRVKNGFCGRCRKLLKVLLQVQ